MGVHCARFNASRRRKGQFWLHMIILHEGAEMSFKTNSFLAGKMYHYRD